MGHEFPLWLLVGVMIVFAVVSLKHLEVSTMKIIGIILVFVIIMLLLVMCGGSDVGYGGLYG